MENSPSFHGWLREHLALNFSFEVTSVGLDVNRLRSAAGACTHQELARSILEPTELMWILVDLHMPELLLLDALFVCLEVVHQVLDLLDFGISIGMHDHGKILHEAEIGTHGVSQASQLTELGNESNLIARASVLVDEQGLVHVGNVLVIPGPVVLLIAGWSPLLVESRGGTLSEVNPIDFVGLLVVSGDHGRTSECFLDGSLGFSAASLGLGTQVIHIAQTVVCPNDLEADVDVEEDA